MIVTYSQRLKSAVRPGTVATIRVLFLILFFLTIIYPAIAEDNKGDTDAETFALAQQAFTSPIVLALGPDASAEASAIDALNGVYGRGPLNQVPNDYSPCLLDSKNPQVLANVARFIGANLTGNELVEWLSKNNVVLLKDFRVRNSFEEHTYSCPILNRDLINSIRSANLVADHFNQSRNEARKAIIGVGKRVFEKWTYRNTYTTPLPGKGNVKIFAGIFTYKIVPMYEDKKTAISTSGTWKVKIYLDPDNGKWVMMDSQNDSPSIDYLSMIEMPPSHPIQK